MYRSGKARHINELATSYTVQRQRYFLDNEKRKEMRTQRTKAEYVSPFPACLPALPYTAFLATALASSINLPNALNNFRIKRIEAETKLICILMINNKKNIPLNCA